LAQGVLSFTFRQAGSLEVIESRRAHKTGRARDDRTSLIRFHLAYEDGRYIRAARR
jgi:hypothetical protein